MDKNKEKMHVIVVGAGAAGLMAARELSAHCRVTVVEANPFCGGRIRTMRSEGSESVIEGGAEFVHGRLPLTLGLVGEAGLEYLPVNGDIYRKKGSGWIKQEEMIEGWDELLAKMKTQDERMTMHDFLMMYYNDAKSAELVRHVRSFVEGFDIADIKQVTVGSLYREWSSEEETFRIPAGYGALVDLLARQCARNGCTVILQETVQAIEWNSNGATVTALSGKTYSADKVIVTVPLGVLKDTAGRASVRFSPPIDHYREAAAKIGYGQVVKVVFRFSEAFWPSRTGFIFCEEALPTWWTPFPVRDNLLTAWAGGPVAEKIMHHSDEELLELALGIVSRLFDKDMATLRNILLQQFVYNWNRIPEAMGAYSYTGPESQQARKLLNTPLSGTVYFAGEGLSEGEHAGMVEAALESGMEVTKRLLER